ncbi:hypothetical protein M404DRAFT_33708, partial [Pisolithus tinctorius Marx 270]
MPSQCQSNTPQPTPGHVRDYSQVVDEELVVLTNDSTNTEREKERKAERKAKHEEAKRRKAEEEQLEAEQKKRAEEEAQRRRATEEEEARKKRAAEEEAERQRQRASQERAQARRDEAAQRLTRAVYDVNTAQKVPGASVVVTATKRAPCTCCIASLMAGQCKPGQGKGKEKATETEEADDEREIGGEDEEEPATPHEGPSGAGVSSWWTEWERERELQAAERYVAAHEKAATAFERMAKMAEWMAEAAEQTANEWGMHCAWAEWVEMRRREDAREARMAEVERTGGGWKRPQSEAVEDKNEEADEGAEGDNEEEVEGEQEG